MLEALASDCGLAVCSLALRPFASCKVPDYYECGYKVYIGPQRPGRMQQLRHAHPSVSLVTVVCECRVFDVSFANE